MREYCKENGAKFNYQTAKKRFGSWENVLKTANLKTEKSIHGIEYGETSLRKELLIQDLKKVSKELNQNNISMAQYDEFGKYGTSTINKRFGGWNRAKSKAGLKIEREYNSSNKEYMLNILKLWLIIF